MERTNTTAIILASGAGKRMRAGKNKVLLEIQKKPLIYFTLKAFERCPNINHVLVVTRNEEIGLLSKIVKKYKLKKIIGIIEGGKERQFSGLNALLYLKNHFKNKKGSLVSFHNGANPLVTPEEISQSISQAKIYGACAVAHREKNTIKEVDQNGMVVRTLDRSRLWSMQTPQTMKFSLAYQAFIKAQKDKFIGTDDVSLVERLGKKVKIIEGSEFNFKITTPLDLEIAKLIISTK